MTHDEVQGWLDRYVEAWKSYDRDAIAELFSEDAEYRYNPWDEPVKGREAIIDDWIKPSGDASRRDAPGTYDGAYTPYAVDDDVAVATGTSTYWKDATRAEVARTYYNTYLLAFDEAGNCRSFIEYYMQLPKTKA
jgi:hypothetical protein